MGSERGRSMDGMSRWWSTGALALLCLGACDDGGGGLQLDAQATDGPGSVDAAETADSWAADAGPVDGPPDAGPGDCEARMEVYFDGVPFCVGQLRAVLQSASFPQDRPPLWAAHAYARCEAPEHAGVGADTVLSLPLAEVPREWPATMEPVAVIVAYVEPERQVHGGRLPDGTLYEGAPLEEVQLTFRSARCLEGVARAQVPSGHQGPRRVEMRFSGYFGPP